MRMVSFGKIKCSGYMLRVIKKHLKSKIPESGHFELNLLLRLDNNLSGNTELNHSYFSHV